MQYEHLYKSITMVVCIIYALFIILLGFHIQAIKMCLQDKALL